MNPSETIRFLCENSAAIDSRNAGPLVGAFIGENGTGKLIFANDESQFSDWSEVEALAERVKGRINT